MLKKNILEIYNIEYLARVYKGYKLYSESIPYELEEFFAENENDFNLYLKAFPLEDEPKNSKGNDNNTTLPANTNLLYVSLAKRIIENYIKYSGFAHEQSFVFKKENTEVKELLYSFYGLNEQTLEVKVNLEGYFGFNTLSFKELFAILNKMFVSTVNYSISHLENEEQQWFVKNIMLDFNVNLNKDQRSYIFKNLVKSEYFESFLATKFVGVKRFGADGIDSFIVFLAGLTAFAKEHKIKNILAGMAHRGRLNSLYNFANKPLQDILAEFLGNVELTEKDKSSDVKYHMGYKGKNNNIEVEILPNPSHLEAVNPVVLGKLKALQDEREESESSLAVLIHGDSAYNTLGVNQETFTLAGLDGYDTKGNLHIVLNNSLGFTAEAGVDYPSNHNSWGHFLKCPVLHIHACKIESLYIAAKVALDYRAKFKKDIFINIIGYRKFGHNEGDEPKFTNPLYYKNTKNLESYVNLYKNKLTGFGFEPKELDDFIQENNTFMESQLKKAQNIKVNPLKFNNSWSNFDIKKHSSMQEPNTCYNLQELKKLGEEICQEPQNFNLNSKIKRQLATRKELIKSGKVDWATAELLAYASLIKDGFNVRISGEDAKRGTFSHRHACYVDQETGKHYQTLQNLKSGAGKFTVFNSTISEFGVLGFDYGYSLHNPNNLTVWEAQFGDFANGGQVIIDQFISSAESKWFMLSNLVMLLPHGLEGQGPEHSSARLERFLQLCATNNMIVAYPTTPANLFHLLRRQVLAGYKKPLVTMSPKSLLRHKDVVSDLSDLSSEGLKKVIATKTKKDFARVLVCTGKVYYDLKQHQEENNIKDVLIIRLEQLYPFPCEALKQELEKIKFKDIFWVQEEHKNAGAYHYVKGQINKILLTLNDSYNIKYVGRELSSAPAVGHASLHNKEKQEVLNKAFDFIKGF